MSNQTTLITDRQLDLITRAHCDANGLIEPLLALKGGVKIKMIASLTQRGLIEQSEGQWRITRAAIAIIKGDAKPEEVLAPVTSTADDATEEDAIATTTTPLSSPVSDSTPAGRGHSKQAQVIEMLKRPEGVTIAQICEATGWQAHSVRGTFAGTFKKRLGLEITSEKTKGSDRVYRWASSPSIGD